MEFYHLRGGKERIFDDMNNGFGWNRLPKSFIIVGRECLAAGGCHAAHPACGGAAFRAQSGHGVQPAQRQAAVPHHRYQHSADLCGLRAVLPLSLIHI